MKLKPFLLERYFAKHEFEAPYLLCSSDCETMTLSELLSLEPGARERFDSLSLGYTEAEGDPALRKAVAALYSQTGPDNILIHSGAEEAIFNFMNVVLQPGDEIIVQAPFYQSLGEVAAAVGAVVLEWQGDPDSGWSLDLKELESLLSPRTKAVVVNFPHNPTGFLPTKEFLLELSKLSDSSGFIILADEVYRGLELNPEDRLPCISDINDRAVSLGVMSKTYGLAGLRIGWLATRNRGLFDKLASFKDYTTICNSAPSEFLATCALKHADTLVANNLEIIRKNLLLLDAFFDKYKEFFDWNRPRAGSIAFPRLKVGAVDPFCADLIEKAGVLLLPGSLYGPGYNFFRIGFGRKNLPESLNLFDEFMEERSRV